MFTIGLIDDHDLFRESLKMLLNSHENFVVSVDSEDGYGFLKKIELNQTVPNLIISDLQMPNGTGRDVLKKMKEVYPEVKVIILSMFAHDHLVSNILEAKADGFLNKDIKAVNLFEAIQHVINGKIVVWVRDQLSILNRPELDKPSSNRISLTSRQVEFLKLCAIPELTYKVIADKMQISPKTADRYREDLFKKLNTNSRTGLVLYALQNGIVGHNLIPMKDFSSH